MGEETKNQNTSDVGRHFPLYDKLVNSISDISLKKSQKNELVRYINNLCIEGEITDQEYIYLLIKCHAIEMGNSNTFDMINLNGTKFNLDKFPNKLQQILYLYMTQSVQAEKERME